MKRVVFVVIALLLIASGRFAPTAQAADSQKPTPAMKQAVKKKMDAAAKPTTQDKAMQTIDQMITDAKVDKSKPNWKTSLAKPTVATFDDSHTYFARMETNKGPVVIKLLPKTAPMHVTNFIYLTRLGFYDGLSFHRVITQFMAQGGDPLGNGMGGPGYGFNGEFDPNVKHDRGGLLSMANAGPGTDGSQFFLTFVATPWLNGKHTIFGEVVEGQDVLKKLEAAGSQSGQTSEPLSMGKVTIEVK